MSLYPKASGRFEVNPASGAKTDGSRLRSDALCSSSQGSLSQDLIAWNSVTKDCVELLLQLEAGPMKTAANRAHGKLKDIGNLVVIVIIDLTQHEDCAVLIAEPGHRPLHLHGPLLAEQPLVGLLAV